MRGDAGPGAPPGCRGPAACRPPRAREPGRRGATRGRPGARRGRASSRVVARSTASRSAKARAPGGSRLAVGSSRTRRPGWGANAPARARRCCSPPESRAVRRRSNPTRPASARAAGTRARMAVGSQPRPSSPNATSSSARSMTSWLDGSWKTTPIASDEGRRVGACDRPAVEAEVPVQSPGAPPTGRARRSPGQGCSCPIRRAPPRRGRRPEPGRRRRPRRRAGPGPDR